MRFLATLTAAFLIAVPAFAADPAGTYRVEGTNPGGRGSYVGSVTVHRTGQTYNVTWTISGSQHVGTGIANNHSFTTSWSGASTGGTALYAPAGNNWTGIWTENGGQQIGTERWLRQ